MPRIVTYWSAGIVNFLMLYLLCTHPHALLIKEVKYDDDVFFFIADRPLKNRFFLAIESYPALNAQVNRCVFPGPQATTNDGNELLKDLQGFPVKWPSGKWECIKKLNINKYAVRVLCYTQGIKFARKIFTRCELLFLFYGTS